jgi:hypothetical protein
MNPRVRRLLALLFAWYVVTLLRPEVHGAVYIPWRLLR